MVKKKKSGLKWAGDEHCDICGFDWKKAGVPCPRCGDLDEEACEAKWKEITEIEKASEKMFTDGLKKMEDRFFRIENERRKYEDIIRKGLLALNMNEKEIEKIIKFFDQHFNN
jgi:hypothetical protein